MDIDYSEIDERCRELCKAMNLLSGIKTIESCSGHGAKPFRIFFRVHNLKSLHTLASNCENFGIFGGWKILIETHNADINPLTFILFGPIGKQAYEEADFMAKYINEQNQEGKN